MSKGKRPQLPAYARMATDLGVSRREREKAVVGYIHPFDSVGAHFQLSIMRLQSFDVTNGQRVIGFIDETSGAQITTARNRVVKAFLENPAFKGADWLWLIDADMVFEPDIVDRLIRSAHPTDRPIVGGLCFAMTKDSEVVPTLFRFNPDTPGVLNRVFDYEPDCRNEVDATGGACVLVHRTVLEKVREQNKPPWPWFQETPTGDDWGNSLSEDVTFFLRCRAAGFPVFVDTSVKLGHVKPIVIDEAFYRAHRPHVEPPAPTFVVIPVKGRHELTDALLRQLAEQAEYESVFLLDNAETSDYLAHTGGRLPAGVEHQSAGGATITEMWNLGVKRAIEVSPGGRCNIAILNNDLDIQCDHFLGRLAQGLRALPQILASYPNYDGRDYDGELFATHGTFKNGGLSGFAFMVRGEAFAAGALAFDEAFRWYYGDDDLVAQIEKLGGVAVMVKSARIEHIGGGSQTSSAGTANRLGTPELREVAEADAKTMFAKWGHY